MGQRENSSGGGGGAGSKTVGLRRQSVASSLRRHVWVTSSSSKSSCLALALFLLSAVALFSSTSASVLPSSLVTSRGEGSTQQQQLPEWPLEVADGEMLNSDSTPRPSPVDVDELATWFSPPVVEEARKAVVGVSPVGRGLDIDNPLAGPAAGSAGVLLDSSALLAGSRGPALNGALARFVPAGTRFVLTSRRAVSSGFARYAIALSDGRRAAARLVYADAFYPVAVLVVVDEREEAEAATAAAAAATAAAVMAAGAGSPLVSAAGAAGASSEKVDPASLPAATLYPPPEDDTRVVGLGGDATAAEEQQESPASSPPPTSSSSSSTAATVVVEPNDPLLFLGQAPDKSASPTTFVGYVSDLRAAFPKTRTPGRGVRGVIARALVARKSPGPGGGAFDVSGRLFGLDVDRDVRGVVAAADKKAEVYVLPAVYLRDALARAVAASLKEKIISRAEPSLRRPRADGGFAATLIPLGIAVDRYGLDTGIAGALRADPRLSGWPNAGGTVPKVIKVAGVDAAGNEGENDGGVRAGDLVVGVVVEDGKGGSVTRLLGDDLHALDDAFARAVGKAVTAAAAKAEAKGGGALASPLAVAGGGAGWGAEPATTTPTTTTAASSSFLARPSPSPEAIVLPPEPPSATVKLVVSRRREGLKTVSARAVPLDGAPAKAERVVVWAGCRFVDPPAAARRLYQFAGPGVALASCDPASPLSAVVNADPREEDEAPTASGTPPPSKTPVVVTAVGGAPTPDLGALVDLLSSESSPAGRNTTVAYRSIHTGRDSYAYVEGVSFAAAAKEQPFRQFVFSGRARRWELLVPPPDGEEEEAGNEAKAPFSPPSFSSSDSLLPLDAEEFRARAAPAKGGSKGGKGQAASAPAASVSASAFVSRGKTAAAPLLLASEDPSDGNGDDEIAQLPLGKPSSLSDATTSDWLSLAAKALGKAPAHASQSVWGSPEALLRVKQQAVQVSINDALPLEHTDATPSAVGTGFVVESTLGIIATNAHVCGPTIGGWEVMFFDGSTTPARQLWYSPSQDIALLAVDPTAIPFPNATAPIASWKTISDADRPALAGAAEMEPLLTVGSPARFAFTLLQGVYLGASYRASDEVGRWRTRNYLKIRTLIQSVAGSSGGAVLNRRGEVVAIHFAGGSNSEFATKFGASPYLWNSFEVAGDYVKSAVGFYKRLYGVVGEEERKSGGGKGAGGVSGGVIAAKNDTTKPPSFLGRTEPLRTEPIRTEPIRTEPIRGASGLVLDLVPLENAVNFFGMPQSYADEAATAPDAPRPRSAMVVASFEPGAPTRAEVEAVLSPGDIIWSVALEGEKEEKIGGDLIRLDELSGLAVEKALEQSLVAGSGNSTSPPPSPSPSLSLSILRRGELVKNVTLPVYDLTADRVRRALAWNGALFHDLSDRTRNYYQLDDTSGGGGGGGGSAATKRSGVFASYREEGAAWPRFYHPAAGGGSGKATTAFAKYVVYEVDGVATPDLDALVAVACSGKGGKDVTPLAPPPPTPAVVVARDLQDDSFPGGEAMDSPVSQAGLTAVEPPRLFEWDAAELVWRQRAACES